MITAVALFGEVFVSLSLDSSGGRVLTAGMSGEKFGAGFEVWDFSYITPFVSAFKDIDLGDFVVRLETKIGLSQKPYFSLETFFWRRFRGIKWGFGYAILIGSTVRFPVLLRLGW